MDKLDRIRHRNALKRILKCSKGTVKDLECLRGCESRLESIYPGGGFGLFRSGGSQKADI